MRLATPPPIFRVALRGEALLGSPRFNKGTAFTVKEREQFGLIGRLPWKVNTLDEQCERAYDQLKSRDTPIRMNSFLQSLKAQNWVLYYTLISRHLKELLPIIYTPTEAEAIADYSHLFRRSEGLHLSFPNLDTMEEDFLEQTRGRDIQLIVCSDAEAILGIGDQGVGGIGISTAKAALYTLVGGVDPSKALPVILDVGTNNEKLLNDHLYVGWPHKRVNVTDYDAFMDKFIQIIRKHYPHSLLHFEDFGTANAYRLLERYRDKHAVFNDDIQGTGAVTLACVMAAIGVTKSKLSDQRFVVYGAGSAGLGITHQLRDAMVATDNISVEEANKKFYLIDRYGLLKASLDPSLYRDTLRPFVRHESEWSSGNRTSLLEVVQKVKPSVLFGCSTHAGAFTEEVVKSMAQNCERPIIMPLSNPSELVEVDPKDANEWTKGQALLATGSPFPPAKMPDGREYIIAECNNALIFPGLGLGATLARSRRMSPGMIIAGAQRLASMSPALKDPDLPLLPDIDDAPKVNREVGVAVAEKAIEEGIADIDWGKDQVREKAEEVSWKAIYGEYVYDPEGDI
ncbi:hypothetical protein AX16_001259 [Volvariella volvacea WC 439]|nr:hypothetical protein AX16_001259 [Volvariella volvacea WC 439]